MRPDRSPARNRFRASSSRRLKGAEVPVRAATLGGRDDRRRCCARDSRRRARSVVRRRGPAAAAAPVPSSVRRLMVGLMIMWSPPSYMSSGAHRVICPRRSRARMRDAKLSSSSPRLRKSGGSRGAELFLRPGIDQPVQRQHGQDGVQDKAKAAVVDAGQHRRPASVPEKARCDQQRDQTGSQWPKAKPSKPKATVFRRCWTVISIAWVATWAWRSSFCALTKAATNGPVRAEEHRQEARHRAGDQARAAQDGGRFREDRSTG